MVPRNGKLMVPRFPDLAGKPFKRSPFLQGDVPVQGGPRQDRLALQRQWGVVTPVGPTNSISWDYATLSPPGDWNRAGSILRKPQVVFISPVGYVNYQGFTGHIDHNGHFVEDSSWHGGANAFSYPNEIPGFDPGTQVGTPGPPWLSSRSNYPLDSVLLPDLGQMCDRVVDRIEKIRPGRTWVVNTCAGGPPFQGFADGPISTYSYFHVYMNGKNMQWPIMVPDSGYTDAYLGTDFLHLYLGAPGFTAPSYYVEASPEFFEVPSYFSWCAVGDNIGYPDTFFSTAIPVDAYSNVGLTTLDQAEKEMQQARPRYLGYACFLWIANDSAAVSYTQGLCTDLKPYGFVFKGYMQEVDDDTLVRAIADHFGFDPDTGKDQDLTSTS